MAYDFSSLKQKVADTKEWLSRELTGIRSGRAAAAILDSVKVDAYGSKMPINQVGSVTVEDARTLRVSAWDAGTVKAIEKAITDAGLGLGVSSDEKGVRVTFPELTSERRTQLKKLVGEKLEQARIALRHERDTVSRDIETKAKAGELSEDEKFRAKEEMQKHIDGGNKELEELAARKEQELAQ